MFKTSYRLVKVIPVSGRLSGLRYSSTSSLPDSITSNATTTNTNTTEQQKEARILQNDGLETKASSELSSTTTPNTQAPSSVQDELNTSVIEVADNTITTTPKKPKFRYNLKSLPRVPSTEGISDTTLYNDLLINNFMPLLSPVKKNHTLTKRQLIAQQEQQQQAALGSKATINKKKTKSVLEGLENFKNFKRQQSNKLNQNSKYYNTYLNKENLKLPYNSIFCNTALNTQQHNLEIFNLPLNYLEKLKPFKLINKPGDEHYRDDLIIVSKLEFELEQQEISKKNSKNSETDELDLQEFFGFNGKTSTDE